ncbi:hypothetical protein SAMN05519103_01465 [Rhizobiales bacterium GAS113]|jgi:hypothetical protein|nr:hypothetical protein SAMN05519103_01465 [Rhizobiales bacterium GAS113]SEC21762.1 hypothetical protein SAMN05519104_0970 [Rhizobiales bacterium GAS188]
MSPVLSQSRSTIGRAIFGFVAGFAVVLTVFQLALLLLYWFGALPDPPPYMAPTTPFGVPALFSSAFFGGLWGILFAFVEPRFPRGSGFWVATLAFGIVPLNLVLWFVVAPLKGFSLGFGFAPKDVLINIFLQGAWGLGMGIIYDFARRTSARQSPTGQTVARGS